MEPAAMAKDRIAFGPFILVASERLLSRNGEPLELGSRTLDTLIALVSRSNEIVSKRELLAQIWPDVTVEEGSLRFHIAELRKVLGDGKDGERYITTLAGRGYCFVAPTLRSLKSENIDENASASPYRTNLPSRLQRMVGRADTIVSLTAELSDFRFVTIVGSGGVGKTTVAVAVAHDLLARFPNSVLFVDLGALNDPGMVAACLASMLGLPIRSDDPLPSVVAYLRDKKMLLIFDNCEHLIESVAVLASQLFLEAPFISMLATSREALRVEGERVYKLAPLAVPPDDPDLTADVALAFPAMQLFLERATASGAKLELTDANAVIVASVCRKLDGVALAIELAAGRVESYGLQQTYTLLEERLSLLWLGQRTAPPRQQTLKATLDWSYRLLADREKGILRQLAVFDGDFTLEAALAVVDCGETEQTIILAAIDNLVAKSLIATRPVGAMLRYRLLDTTRTYAIESGSEDVSLVGLGERHATYYSLWLKQAGSDFSTVAERAQQLAGLANVRSALEWCFGKNNNLKKGVELASAATPVFLAMSLLTECHRWSERAIATMSEAERGGSDEMLLQKALGLSCMFTQGNTQASHAALDRSLTIADECGDAVKQQQLLGALHMFHQRVGEIDIALGLARRSVDLARTTTDLAATALACSNLGISLSCAGDLIEARKELETALDLGQEPKRSSTVFQGFDHFNIAGIYLARTLWLQGHPDQALERAHQTVKDAARIDHPVTLSIALTWAASVLLWTGDIEGAEEYLDWATAHAKSHSLMQFLVVAQGFRGDIAIRRGYAEEGIEILRASLQQLQPSRYGLPTPSFNISIIQGLAAMGEDAKAITLAEETDRLLVATGHLSYMPELLRVKGSLLSATDNANAEVCFLQSLDWSRRQGAMAWELRTATDLASFIAIRGRADEARSLLARVTQHFINCTDYTDLKAAEEVMDGLAIRS